MSLGSWDPNTTTAESNFYIDNKQLEQFIELSHQQQLEQLAAGLSPAQQQEQAGLMTQSKECWFTAAEHFDDEQIIALMRFFTLAEQLPGWEAGDKSPVIWLGKVLKKRGSGIDRELVLWIKAHSKNQYLPHGSLL